MSQSYTLKAGKCPKCAAADVYVYNEQRGERARIVISSFQSFFLSTYLCVQCGHFEEYIKDVDLHNEKMIEKIKKTWSKITPTKDV